MKLVISDMASSDTKSKGIQGDSEAPNLVNSSAPARLCYVDDSRTSAYVVKRMLRPFGYVVDHFESAEPALIALVQGSYDLLLTDLKVSPKGMDGDDLVRALRSSGHNNVSSLPIIVITGSTDSVVLADVYEAGANQIMTKPVNGDELNVHIRQLVYANQKKTKNNGDSDDGLADFVAVDSETLLAEVRKSKSSKAQKSGEMQTQTAQVIKFDEHGKSAKETDLPDLDSIPVLNSPSELTTIDSKAESVKLNATAENDRRVLLNNTPGARGTPRARSTPGARGTPGARSNAGINSDIVLPRPSGKSVLAPKVRPSLKARPRGMAVSATSKNSAAARQEAALRAKAAVKAAQNRQLAKAQRIKAANLKKNSEAAVALNKLKSAATLKKAQIAKKQKAIAVAKAAVVNKKKAAQLQSEQLSLEPLEVESHFDSMVVLPEKKASSGKRDKQDKAAKKSQLTSDKKPLPKLEHPMNAKPGSQTGHNPVELRHPLDSGIMPSAQSNANRGNSSGLQPFGGNSNLPQTQYGGNILHEMDRFPLVDSGLNENFGPSRFLSALVSVFELYGAKKIIFMAFAMIFLFFTYNWWGALLDEGTPVDITIVEQGDIFQSITVPGKVVSKLRVDLTPAIAGRLTSVNVDEGDSVKKGDLLATLDNREATSFLKRAEAGLGSAREDVELAKRSLDRLSQAFKKGAVARQLVEDAEVDLRSAKARESITEEEVQSAKLSLENPRIIAAFSGVVTARYVEVGQWVVPSETLFTLIDPKQREIEVKVDAADSGGIAVGQTVGVSSDAFPGLDWSESVVRLAAAATNVGNANTISVYISLGTNAPSLRFGQQVDADIRTAWNPNAVKVPYGAIVNHQGRTYVAVLEEGHAILVEVNTGIEDFSHIEILQGVGVGETVILTNGKHIKDGERVYLSVN